MCYIRVPCAGRAIAGSTSRNTFACIGHVTRARSTVVIGLGVVASAGLSVVVGIEAGAAAALATAALAWLSKPQGASAAASAKKGLIALDATRKIPFTLVKKEVRGWPGAQH